MPVLAPVQALGENAQQSYMKGMKTLEVNPHHPLIQGLLKQVCLFWLMPSALLLLPVLVNQVCLSCSCPLLLLLLVLAMHSIGACQSLVALACMHGYRKHDSMRACLKVISVLLLHGDLISSRLRVLLTTPIPRLCRIAPETCGGL